MTSKIYSFETNSEHRVMTPANAAVQKTDQIQRIESVLNFNDYASRKSLAQGLLDLSLLAANATQLKKLLTTDSEKSEFFEFLLVLVIISIVLQVVQAVLIIILGIIFDINNTDEQRKADITNNTLVGITTISVFVNVVISAFDMNSPINNGDNMFVNATGKV